MNSKYSVIVPVYKVKKEYLAQCIESILNQTYKNIELILVDDGSPDQSGQYCDEFAKQDQRITVIHKENGGSASARNMGIKRATGEWISFIDADDWYETSLFDDIENLKVDNNTDVIMFGCSKEYVNQSIAEPAVYENMQEIVRLEEREELQCRMLSVPGKRKYSSILSSVWSKLYRRKFLTDNNIFMNERVRYNEDCLFCLEVYEKMNKLVNLTNSYYHYRTVASGKTNIYRDSCDQEQRMIIKELNDYASTYNKKDSFIYAIYLRTLVSIQMCFNQKYYHNDYPKELNRRKDFSELLETGPFSKAMEHIEMSSLNKHFLLKYICYKYHCFGLLKSIDRVYRKRNRFISFT